MNNSAVIAFTVPGEPIAKARPRLMRSGKVYTPAATTRWESTAKLFATQAMAGRKIITCPLALSVECFFSIPESWPKWRRKAAEDGRVWHTATPDLDNIIKIVGDALNGVAFRDDSLAVFVHGHKSYSTDPRVEISITAIPGGLTCTSRMSDLDKQ